MACKFEVGQRVRVIDTKSVKFNWVGHVLGHSMYDDSHIFIKVDDSNWTYGFQSSQLAADARADRPTICPCGIYRGDCTYHA